MEVTSVQVHRDDDLRVERLATRRREPRPGREDQPVRARFRVAQVDDPARERAVVREELGTINRLRLLRLVEEK